MRHVPVLPLSAVSLSILASATSTHAYLSSLTVDKCLAGKLAIVGKGAAAYAKCHGKNAAKPDAVAFDKCQTKTSTKIIDGFGKLDAKNPTCTGGTGNGSARDASSATFGDDVNAAVGSSLGKCDAAKQACVGKYVAAIMGCYAKAAKAAKTSGAVDNATGGCTDKASQKLADTTKGCLAKAAAHADCSNAGTQQGTLQPVADTFSLAQSCALDPANPGCGGPTQTPTPTATATPTPEACQKTDGGFCWFVAQQDTSSCDDVCSQNSLTYDSATETYAGSGGTDENCAGLLTEYGSLAFSGPCPLPGVGCGVFSALGWPVRCVTPATTSSAATTGILRVCACQ